MTEIRHKKEPTLSDVSDQVRKESTANVLSKLAKDLDSIPVESFAPKRSQPEKEYNKTWLQGMADVFLDARYGEMKEMAKGFLSTLPSDKPVDIDMMAQAIYDWAKNYKEE